MTDLKTGEDDRTAENRRVFRDQHAPIAEVDGRLSVPDAEAVAHACRVANWLNRHPERASSDSCFGCQRTRSAGVQLVLLRSPDVGAFATPRDGHGARLTDRLAEATAVLPAMEIGTRSETR